MKNYYEILEIDVLASPREVKTAFRLLAHKFHPDKQSKLNVVKDHEINEFRMIHEAYEILSDEEKRLHYDRKLLEHFKRVAKSKGYKLKNNKHKVFEILYMIALSLFSKRV